MKLIKYALALLAFTLILPTHSTQTFAQTGEASAASKEHAGRVAKACIKRWTTQKCLKTISESNLALVANYGTTLKERGLNVALNTLKEHCAASTAAANGKYSSKTMRSAYVECANIIVDVTQQTGVAIDASHYQLLVGAVLCLDKNPSCYAIEKGLKQYR